MTRIKGISNRTMMHFRRDGRAKRGYASEGAAREAATINESVYRCALCGEWHRSAKAPWKKPRFP